MRHNALLLSFAALAGCTELTMVQLQGTLLDAPEGEAAGLAGATVWTANAYGEEIDRTTSRPEGGYRVEAVGGQRTYVHVEGEGYATASFTGNAGMNPRHHVYNGEITGVSDAYREGLREQYAGCPGNEPGATAIFGEVRIDDWVIDEESPLVITAQVNARTEADVSWSACYLTDEEDSTTYDPAAERTGATGRFALFGADAGFLIIEVRYDVYDDIDSVTEFDLWLLEGGVAPRFPFYVPFATAP